MEDKKYNGWFNYATFRVHHDILCDIDFEEVVTEDQLKEIFKDVVFRDESSCYFFYYFFLNQVNWEEIAKIYNEDILNLQTKHE